MSCSNENCSNQLDYTPNTQNTVQSQAGRFGLCSITWNKDSGSFRPANETEKEFCCLNSSKSSARECLETCQKKENIKDYNNCTKNCARNIILVEDICSQSTPDLWRGNSPLIKCIEENGFGKYPNYNVEEIKNNKDMLIKCCHSGCIPTSEIACVDHCKRKYADMIGESEDPLLILYDTLVKVPPIKPIPPTSDNSWIYYLVTLGVVIFVVAVILLIKRYRKKL